MTGTLSKLSGLSVFTSGMMIIGLAKLTTVAVLFLLLETLTGSSRLRLASFIYAGNPNFLFWDSQFAYESLAIPLALVAVYLLLRKRSGRGTPV